jgi:hypothetical protein
VVKPERVETKDSIADLFTKPFGDRYCSRLRQCWVWLKRDYLFGEYLETYPALPRPSSSDTACVMPWERHCPVALLFVLHSLGAYACPSPGCWLCTCGWEPNVQRCAEPRSSCYRPTVRLQYAISPVPSLKYLRVLGAPCMVQVPQPQGRCASRNTADLSRCLLTVIDAAGNTLQISCAYRQ